MKNLSTFILIALLSMTAGRASAYDAEIDGIQYIFNGDEAEAHRTSYQLKGKIVIPASVTYNGKTYSVTTIGAQFVTNKGDITSVEIPNTVKSIGQFAFSDCYYLNSVTIPNSVTSIGQNAFERCSSLTSIELPNAITKIEGGVFQVSGLTSITIPNSVTSIGNSAFSSSKLKTVNFGNSVESIGSQAFGFCDSLRTVILPNSVKTIGGGAFINCDSLEYVALGNSVESIGSGAFKYCQKLSIDVPSVETWLNISFDNEGNPMIWAKQLLINGKELRDLVIPNTVTEIKSYAFKNLKLLSVTIPNSVTTIGREAFSGCDIHSLIIGSGVVSIGSNAFPSSASWEPVPIKKIIWLTNTPPSGYQNAAGIMNYVSNEQFHFTNNTQKTFIYPLLSSMFAVDGVKYVPTSMADRTCEAIDAVYDESAKLTKLGTTTSYRNVKFTVNYVRPYTCCGNTFIENVELTDLPFIEDYVFDGCTNLRSAKLPETVAWLGLSSFQDCASLQEIAIPAATTEVKHNSFKGCSALKNVTMKDGNSGLNLAYNGSVSFDYQGNINVYNGTPLFEDCPLYKVYIGRNITYGTKANEGYSPFYRNTSLRSVEITDQETEIGENEFYGCSGLKKVKIGDGVTTFGNWAFSGCSSLDYFEFGSSVKTIGKEAFSDCSAVTNVISHTAVPPTCGSQAMDDISKWDCTLTVPDGTIDAYAHADQWKEFLFAQEYSAYLAGVDDIRADSKDCRQKVFSLSGQRLTAPRKGLNIIGGRKIIVK